MKHQPLPDLPPMIKIRFKPDKTKLNDGADEAMIRAFRRFSQWKPMCERGVRYNDNLRCYVADIERWEGGICRFGAFPERTG